MPHCGPASNSNTVIIQGLRLATLAESEEFLWWLQPTQASVAHLKNWTSAWVSWIWWRPAWGPMVWWAPVTCSCPGISRAMWRRCGLTAVPSTGVTLCYTDSRVVPRNAARCCVSIGRAVTKPVWQLERHSSNGWAKKLQMPNGHT